MIFVLILLKNYLTSSFEYKAKQKHSRFIILFGTNAINVWELLNYLKHKDSNKVYLTQIVAAQSKGKLLKSANKYRLPTRSDSQFQLDLPWNVGTYRPHVPGICNEC